MAIEAKMFSENLGFGYGGPQDLLLNDHHNNNNNNASGFNFINIPQRQQQQQQQQKLQKQHQFLMMDFDHFQNLSSSHQKQQQNNSTSCFVNNNHQQQQVMNNFSPNISAQIDKQRMELDGFITLQNERLRLALQEQRKQQLALFLKKYEAQVQFLLKQKDEEITKAAKGTMELEQFLKRIEIETQTWQRVARENEAMVASLNGTIERLKETAVNAADDAGSCCRGGEEEEEEEERNGKQGSGAICKGCNSRECCVIMLPCRHMSCCKYCEAFLGFCPVCKTVKKATIEALLS